MAWLWDQRTMQLHDLSRAEARCGIEGIPPGMSKTYEDQVTATTVAKTRHLVPCRWCTRPGGARGPA